MPHHGTDDDSPDPPRARRIPAYDQGGRVRETGIALVHEGEYILPAPGAEARIDAAAPGDAVVHYHFPVEVVVVGGLGEEARREIEDHIWESLADALERGTD